MTANPNYLNDLIHQPQALRETLTALRGQTIPSSIPNRLADGSLRRIVLTGMGSSCHVFHPLQQALVRRGLDAYLVETSELLYSMPGLLKPDTLVIAASQSGRSAEIITLLERRAGAFPMLGVSNTPGSPLAAQTDGCLLTQAGEEFTVSCKTYLAMLAALSCLEALLLGDDTAPVLDELEAAVPAVGAYLSQLDQHVADLKGLFARTRDLFFVGRGPSLAAVGLGGLINKEAAHAHSEGLSSASFRHGPFEMVGPESFVIIYEGEGYAAELNRKLYDDVTAAGIPAGWVSEQSTTPVFRLPKAPSRARPLLEALPAEMTTLALAALKGHEAGTFTRGSKVTTEE